MEKLEGKKVVVMLYDKGMVEPIGIIPDYENRNEFISEYFGISEIKTEEVREGFNVESVMTNFFGNDSDEEDETIRKMEKVKGVETYKNTINGKEQRNWVDYTLLYKSVEEYK